MDQTDMISAGQLRDCLKDMAAFCLDKREAFLSIVGDNEGPFYIFDGTSLDKRASRIREAFSVFAGNVKIYYAVKSNNHPLVSNRLVGNGIGLDVSSGPELSMAIEQGCKDIIFTGPGKTDAELQMAIDNRDSVIVWADSFSELESLCRLTADISRPLRIGVRLNVNPDGLWRKFGIAPEELSKFIGIVSSQRGLKFTGLHFHSSWNMNAKSQVEIIGKLAKILKALPKNQQEMIKVIDIGGGYWPEPGEIIWEEGAVDLMMKSRLAGVSVDSFKRIGIKATPIEDFASDLAEAFSENMSFLQLEHVFIEPGRWLCNECLHIMMKVVDKKCDDLVIANGGTNTLGWERLESDIFPVVNLSRPLLKENACHILGSLCTPHDIWGFSYWGEGIEKDDWLVVPFQGAYTYSLRQNFIKPLPQTLQF